MGERHDRPVPVCLAFLRAINLGATRKFPRSEVVAATEAAGFTGVATHLNTGNVRGETRMRARPRIEAALEAAYLERTGFEVPTIVLTPAELRAVVAEADELAASAPDAGGAHYVSLLKSDPNPAAARDLEALGGTRTTVRVSGRAVHLLLSEAYHSAPLTNAHVEKRLGPATNRNLTVLRAIAEKWC